jgi:hypothetical protein
MTLLEVGGLAAVGEPDPKAQVVVGELTGRIHAVAEHVEGAEVALLPWDDLAQPQVEGAAESSRIHADAGQPDRPLRCAGQDELNRDDPRDHVSGRLDPGRPAVLDLRLRQLRRLGRGHHWILTHTSWAFTQRAKESGLLPSMGTIGDAYDNAVIESFWARMQTELLDRRDGPAGPSSPMRSLSTWRSSTTANDATAPWVGAPLSNSRSSTPPTSPDSHSSRSTNGAHTSWT